MYVAHNFDITKKEKMRYRCRRFARVARGDAMPQHAPAAGRNDSGCHVEVHRPCLIDSSYMMLSNLARLSHLLVIFVEAITRTHSSYLFSCSFSCRLFLHEATLHQWPGWFGIAFWTRKNRDQNASTLSNLRRIVTRHPKWQWLKVGHCP